MSGRLSKVTAFFLGSSPQAEDDDFESELTDPRDDEPTDIVDIEAVRPVVAERVVERARPVRPSSVTSLDQHRRSSARSLAISQILHVRPYSFSEAARIGESFKDGVPVILNLSTTDEKQAQKLIDFASGMAFVTDGKLERITPRVFILIPSTVVLTQTDKDQIAEAHRLAE
ncbi:MAG: cell division protein SepF [Propionibacteriaceae bacterium]|nr:cell division protein SepF [Propionibacteriaceae bacterium]